MRAALRWSLRLRFVDMARALPFIFMVVVCSLSACAARGDIPVVAVDATAQASEERAVDVPAAEGSDEESADASKFVTPFPGVRVRIEPATVEVNAVRCLDAGWLEQVACSPGTREHEALVVVEARPSHIHAALLMAGFDPGEPGKWIYHDEQERIEVKPPTGAPLTIVMRYEKNGETVEVPVRRWIRDHLGESEFPNDPWVFAGSQVAENPEFMGPGEHYVADQTGSIIGLVTFGDELIAYSKVIADQVAVQPAEWEVNTDTVPPVDTKVTVVITPWEE